MHTNTYLGQRLYLYTREMEYYADHGRSRDIEYGMEVFGLFDLVRKYQQYGRKDNAFRLDHRGPLTGHECVGIDQRQDCHRNARRRDKAGGGRAQPVHGPQDILVVLKGF